MIPTVTAPQAMYGRKIDLNSKEFYKLHPDLAPRNVYLREGRIYTRKEAKRTIENFGQPIWVRVKNWFKYKIEDIFYKK